MRGVVVALALLTLGGGASAAGAHAYVTAPGVTARDFARGFATGRGQTGWDDIGPVGVTFDAHGRLYVADSHAIYRFGSQGGAAGGRTRLNAKPIAGDLTGLTFTRDGALYAARRTGSHSGSVLQIDWRSGKVLRTIATHLPGPTGVAADPRGGDLYVSTADCADGVVRIAHVDGARPKVTAFVQAIAADGLTFDRDGQLYIAHAPDATRATVSVISRTGRRRALAVVPGADGTALAAHGSRGSPPFLVVNRHDGTITRVDLVTHATTDIVTGGTRGDLTAVGPDGCLYATQTDSVVKVCAAGGGARTGAASTLAGGFVPTTLGVLP